MIKQNPFSVYDFLGYFIPGALLIYLSVFIDYFKTLPGEFVLEDFLNSNKDFQIDQVLFFIIISYALGHLINFLSSMTIEKFALWKYDYPSKFLLGFDKKNYWRKNTKSGYLWRILLPILIFPVALFDLLLGEILNLKDVYTRKLDEFLIDLIKHKGILLVNSLFGNNAKPQEIRNFDFFRIFAHYTFENSKNHQHKLSNYVALYGFLRTLTLIGVICFWYAVYNACINCYCNLNIFIIIIFGIISYIFFMAFMKFYRRYTLEGLMLIAIDQDLK